MGKINKSPSYLLRVSTLYHFRYVFPKKYCNLLAGEIRVSLNTGSLKVARPLAAMLANATGIFINGKKETAMGLTKKEIKAALGAYLRATLELNEESRLKGREPFQTDERGIDMKTLNDTGRLTPESLLKLNAIALKDQLSGKENYSQYDDGAFISEEVNEFLKGSGLPEIFQEDPLHKFVHKELLKIKQAINRIEQDHTQGNYNTPTELSVLAAYPDPEGLAYQQPSNKIDPKPISQLIDQYINENVSDNKWKASTLKEYKNHLKSFIEITGDCDLSELNHDITRTFFDKLKALPPNRSKIKVYMNKTIPELLDMDLPPETCLSPQTINNTMQSLSAFFNWAVTRQYMSVDYTKGMKVKINQKAADLKDPFSDVELKILFDELEAFRNEPNISYRWWVSLIALYTGARLEEISQLHVEDIRKQDEVWVFDINDKGEKGLKNINSRRLIPIHDQLIQCDFLEYFEKTKAAGEIRLFPTLKPLQGKYGHYISKWFGSFLKKLKIKSDLHNVSFHSFRHTFITKAKHSELLEGYIKQIVGHSEGSIDYDMYGKAFLIVKLKEIIDQIVFCSLFKGDIK